MDIPSVLMNQASENLQGAVQMKLLKNANDMQGQVLQLIDALPPANLQPEGVGRMIDLLA